MCTMIYVSKLCLLLLLTITSSTTSTFSPSTTVSPTQFPTQLPSSSPSLAPSQVPTLVPTASLSPFRFGQSSALTGLSGDLGTNMKAGTLAAFRKVNNAGGIHGRLLELISYDDMYDSVPAANNTRELLRRNVIGCLSYVGTATTQEALSITKPARVPMIAPFTGAQSMRRPANRYVINTRASYDEEIHAWVSYCLSRGITLFSIFYQDDPFGMSGLTSLTLALDNQGLKILSRGVYARNSLDVQPGLDQIKAQAIDPQAIVMIGTGAPLARFVSLAKKQWPNALLYSVSFLGSEAFLEGLRFYNVSSAEAKDVFVTQVFPIPQPLSELTNVSHRSAVLYDFVMAMNESCHGCPLTFGALEGYVAGTLVAQVLERMGEFSASNVKFGPYMEQENVNSSMLSLNDSASLAAWREFFLDTLFEQSTFEISGLHLGPYVQPRNCTPNYVDCLQPAMVPCSQGMQNVFLTQPDVVNNRYVELFDWRVQTPACGIRSEQVPLDLRPIVFGQTAAFTGDPKDLGIGMRDGILAAFNAINKSPSRGIRSRQLLLMSYDDYYLPNQAVINAKNMVANQSFLAVVGATGTSTSIASLPTFLNASIPLIGPLTGSRALRQSGIINVRAQYDDECAAIVDYALSRGLQKISLLRQDDGYGDAGLAGLTLALQFHKSSLYSVASYPRLTDDVLPAFNNLTKAGIPDVMVLFTTISPAVNFTLMMHNSSAWANTVIFAVSPVQYEAFQKALPQEVLASGRVLMTAVVPPLSNSSEISHNYLAALNLLDPSIAPTFASLEGYVVGRLIIYALSRALQLSGASLLAEIYTAQEITIDDLILGPYNDSCNLGMRRVWLLALGPTGSTLLGSYRTPRPNAFTNDCGTLTLYDDAKFSCPNGYVKTYTNASNLEATCMLCLSPFGCTLPEREPDMALRQSMLVLSVLGCVIAVVLGVIVLKYRDTVTIKAVSPPFCLLMLLGSLLGYGFVIVQYRPYQTEGTCMAQVYLLNTSFCLIFGSLFAKVFRVTQLFKSAKKNNLRVTRIQDSTLYMFVAASWTVEMVYTIVWHTLSPLLPAHLSNGEESYYTCKASNPNWGIANILGNGALLLYGILLSIQSRNIPSVFNEAKYVAATLYNTMIIGTIAILAGYELADNDDELYLHKGLGAFIVFTVEMGLLIGSKLPSLWEEVMYNRAPEFKNNSSSNTSNKSGGDPDKLHSRDPTTRTTHSPSASSHSPSPSGLTGVSLEPQPSSVNKSLEPQPATSVNRSLEPQSRSNSTAMNHSKPPDRSNSTAKPILLDV